MNVLKKLKHALPIKKKIVRNEISMFKNFYAFLKNLLKIKFECLRFFIFYEFVFHFIFFKFQFI